MRQTPFWPLVGIAAPPLLLALVGLFHPSELSKDTAQAWTTLHLFLMLVFPLLGVNFWWLVTGITGVSAWAIRVTGFLFMVYYGGMNLLSGIASGLVVQKTLSPASPEVNSLMNAGDSFSEIGGWAFFLGSLVVLFLYWQLVGRRAFAGSFLLIASAVLMLNAPLHHQLGWLPMLCMAAGFVLLMQCKPHFKRTPSV